MQVSITFRHMDPSSLIKQHVEEKIKRVCRFLEEPIDVQVVLTVEKFRHIAEITISDNSINLKGQDSAEDMFTAVDLAVEKVDHQIRKRKGKIKEHRSGEARRRKAVAPVAEVEAEEEEEVSTATRKIVKTDKFYPKPITVEEAAMELEAGDDGFIVFTNSETGKVSVLYKRKDGDLGLIEPY